MPALEALADVLYRLADPNIPGNEKLPLVQDATGPDAAALDTFATALRDNGFSPMTITASDIAWSPEQPGDVLATVEFAAADTDDPEGFSFPMGFRRTDAGWQLTRDTAEELFAIGGPSAGAPPRLPALTGMWIGWLEFDVLLGDVHSPSRSARWCGRSSRSCSADSASRPPRPDGWTCTGVPESGVAVVAADRAHVVEVLDAAERMVAGRPEIELLSVPSGSAPQ